MNVVLYMRYSSDRQTEQSIEGQQRICTAYCERNGYHIVGVYIDRALSASKETEKRLEFQRMIRDSEKRAFEGVVVYKLDRFARSRYDSAKYKAILRTNGVRVISATEAISENIEGILMESMLEGLAEYYSAELAQKVTRGMRESAYKCQFNGSGLALGYTIDENKKFQIDPVGAALVRKIYEFYDAGMKQADILRWIKQYNLRTTHGNEYTQQNIRRILKNRLYTGEYHWKDIVVPGGVPRIIDDNLFERVQARMARNKTIPAGSRGKVKFLLTGKLYCGHCHGTMIGDHGTGKSGNKFYYYSCRARKTKHECDKKSVKRDWLEQEVTRLTVEHVLQDDHISYISNRIVALYNREIKSSSDLEYFTGKLRETETAISNLMKAIEAGIITASTKQRLEELEAERAEYEIAIANEQLSNPTLTEEQVAYFLSQFQNGDLDDKAIQERIINMLVHKVIVYSDKLIITYNFIGNDDHSATTVAEIEATAEDAIAECSDGTAVAPPKAPS